jgi:hypothetical protein
MSISVALDDGPGAPTLQIDNFHLAVRIPTKLTFEASGPYHFNGVTPEGFIFLWYAGEFNGRESFSPDGLPVTWPLDRDGDFVVYADSGWNMVRRSSGADLMHWKSDSSFLTVGETPAAAKSESQPHGWYGVADGCTGYVNAHYGAEHTEAQYLPYFLNEAAAVFVVPDPRAKLRFSISLPDGQTGYGKLQNIPQTPLTGGS